MNALRCALISVCWLVVAGCHGHLHVRGRVVDMEGQPVASARVHIVGPGLDAQGVSDENGCFDHASSADEDGLYTVEVEHAGYQTASAQVESREFFHRLRWKLSKKNEQTPSFTLPTLDESACDWRGMFKAKEAKRENAALGAGDE